MSAAAKGGPQSREQALGILAELIAHAARTRDLFFVADGNGGHSFTETYEQHQKNVARLRTMEKQIQNDAVEPLDEPAPAVAPTTTETGTTQDEPSPKPAPRARTRPNR